MKLHIVLVNPEIPQNTGNIGRTCVALNACLHLIRPLGFELDSKYAKRAALDYWDKLDLQVHDDTLAYFSFFKDYTKDKNILQYALSSKVKKSIFDIGAQFFALQKAKNNAQNYNANLENNCIDSKNMQLKNEIYLDSKDIKNDTGFVQKNISQNDEKIQCFLYFGNESGGLNKDFMNHFSGDFVTINMNKDCRCLNLSNAVAIASYEILRAFDELRSL